MLLEAHEVGEPTAKWYYPLAKASASFVSLISAIPGGLFDPSLATGVGLGQLCYPILNGYIAPGIGLPEVMMIFMCAYFTGVVQSPITVFTIMFEMTGAYGMILPAHVRGTDRRVDREHDLQALDLRGPRLPVPGGQGTPEAGAPRA